MILSDIEHALMQQGNFCLLDWLLHNNHIFYTDYELWRYGKVNYLEVKINLEADVFANIIESVNTLSENLQLESQQQEYYSWLEQPRRLKISKNKDLERELTQRWVRPEDLPQMDLFMDNAAVAIENTLLETLAARQFDRAQIQLEKLTGLNPAHDKLGDYQDLLNYGHHMLNHSIDQLSIGAEFEGLENEVTPLARTILRQGARDYLAFAWRRLAENLKVQVFDPIQEKHHSSYALMQIPDWRGALASLSEEAERYQQPTLLLRMAQCFEALKKTQQALLYWCLLMELNAEACESAIEAKISPVVWELWQDFWDVNEHFPLAFFPAYLFLRQPGLIHYLDEIPPLKSPAIIAVIDAIQARVKKEDEIPYRKKLQGISPMLLQLFMVN